MLPCGEEVPIVGDPALLRQLLADLLANAVTLSFPHARVQLVVDIAGDFARVRVMDEGRGIPSGERAHLFESVLPLAGSGETDASGTGLATVKSVVEAHRGFVGIVDTPGWSTTVQVLIPLRTQSESETKGIESALYAAGPAPD
jgi:signal transduction histidine kinase